MYFFLTGPDAACRTWTIRNYFFQIKAYFYLLAAATVADVETQRRGFVWISYYTELFSLGTSHWRFCAGIQRALVSIPIRNVACHYCHSSITLRPLLNFGVMMAPPGIRTRVRVHYGKDESCLQHCYRPDMALRDLDSHGVSHLVSSTE